MDMKVRLPQSLYNAYQKCFWPILNFYSTR